jgi:Nucleotidyltransferase domain
MSELRQWTHIRELAKAAARPPFLGAVLLGSFARGDADELSDVDFIVFAAEGSFAEGWERRHSLHRDDAHCWDYARPPGDRDVAAHRWLTADFVLFDGLLATPSGTRVAEPMHVLVGGRALTRQLVKRDPITPDEQEQRRDEIELNPVERLYGELKLALRAHD